MCVVSVLATYFFFSYLHAQRSTSTEHWTHKHTHIEYADSIRLNECGAITFFTIHKIVKVK